MRPSTFVRAPLPRRLVALANALLLMAALLIAQAPAAAAAGIVTDLGVAAGRGGDVVARGSKVFVAADDRIIVTSLDGRLIDTIGGLSGAVALAAPDGGRKVYAALRDSHEVIEIDTVTVTITRRIDLAAYPCPSNLVQSYDRLWVGYGCGQAGEGGVVGLILSAAAPTPVPIGPGTTRPPLVAVARNTLVTAEPGVTPAVIRVYDVSTTPATPRGEIRQDTGGLPPLRDLALTEDGSTALSASADTHRFDAWDTTTLAQARPFGDSESSDHGLAAAITADPDGAYVVGGRNSSDTAELVVYDATTAEVIYATDHQGKELVAGSIAFYGTLIWGVLKEPDTGRMHLWRLPPSPFHSSTLTLTAPPEATALEQFTLSGRLTLSTGSLPGVQTLEVNRWLPDGTSRPFQEITTAADGTYEFTDTPPSSGTFEYRVYWPGNSWYRGRGASATVTVTSYQPVLTVDGPATGVVGDQLEFSGSFGADGVVFPPTTITVSRKVVGPDGTVTSKALPKVAPASDGSFGFADTPATAGEHTYTIRLAGNSAIGPAHTIHTVTVLGSTGIRPKTRG
ncbi:hypothetical protein Sme01_47700 [Sphaerisporangium melleum]|uniref:40-residue YVTN family beta-propeller repeat-containing protein n=1 Tax=Sphaerisporangium melleum TaxID=321316 RepID=A0A917RRQ1_9ACTN|nr:hypothetical protein [Sphaerisporangium melleum]GGL18911.1 hypothetical protein GCM10007964_71170 [Sphaerisporangium melleum]GII72294.1 hypothetical protein Sme01_47700 [Sphaerisporangium melleum]